MLMPRVSVVIPTYNHAKYVLTAVESVLDQSYPNIEVIVVDDGSTDETAKLLKTYNPRINYIYKSNGGTPSALNAGLITATGKYICWLSADDAFLPDKVSKQVALMEENSEFGFCYTSFVVIDAQGQEQYPVHSSFYPERREMVTELMKGCFINGSSVMLRKSALSQIGLFDEGLPQAHDYDLWLRFLLHYSCGFIDELLLAYRWHGQNMSQSPNEECILHVKERAKLLFPEWLS